MIIARRHTFHRKTSHAACGMVGPAPRKKAHADVATRGLAPLPQLLLQRLQRLLNRLSDLPALLVGNLVEPLKRCRHDPGVELSGAASPVAMRRAVDWAALEA